MKLDAAIENVKSLYLECLTAWDPARSLAEDCFRFMLNEQWTDEEKAGFIRNGMAPVQYNMILPRVNNLTGTEQLNRRSIVIRPFYSSQRELASILTGLFKQVWETKGGENELSRVFTDGLITPLVGSLKISVEPDPAGFMEYNFRALNPFSVFYDPDSCDYELRDCQYILQESWLRLDEIIDAYGEHGEMTLKGYAKKWWETLSEEIGDKVSGWFGVSDRQSQWWDKQHNLYKIIEMQTRVTVPKRVFLDHNSGEYLLLPPAQKGDPSHEEMAKLGLEFINDTKTKKVHITTVCPYFNVMLVDEDNWLDTEMYDIIPYTSFDLGVKKCNNSSLVKALIDPQKNINKREIQKTAYIDRAMISPMVFSMEDRDTREDYDKRGNLPGYSMMVRNLKFPPHRIPPSTMPPDVWNDLEDSKDKLNDISAINETARGQSEHSNESGRLYNMKTQRLGATINPYFKPLSKTRVMVGKYFVQTCPQVYPELNRVVSVLDSQKKTSTVVLNQQVGEDIKNRLAGFMGDVIVDEGEHSPTKLQENAQTKMALASIMPPEFVNWRWILKDSDLPDVEEQIEYIEMVTRAAQQKAALEEQMAVDQYAQQSVLANQPQPAPQPGGSK